MIQFTSTSRRRFGTGDSGIPFRLADEEDDLAGVFVVGPVPEQSTFRNMNRIGPEHARGHPLSLEAELLFE